MRPITTLLICTVFSSTVARSQTITVADAPSPGDELTFVTVQDVGPLSSGTSQTWTVAGDFEPAEHIEVIPVGQAAGASDFPMADVAFDSDNGAFFGFFRTTAGGLDYLGTYNPIDGDTEFYSDPDRWIPYPCSYGTTWTDGYTVLDGPGGNEVTTFGPEQWTADGYGTLVGPGGSLTNVLKTHQEVVTTETVNDDVIVTTQITDRFWKPGYSGFVALASQYEIVINGNMAAEGSGMVVVAELATGMDEHVGASIGMQVVPNPVTGTDCWVDYSSAAATSLRIVSSAGQVIHEQALSDRGPGIHRAVLPTSKLAAGLYHVELRNAQGERGVARVVVE